MHCPPKAHPATAGRLAAGAGFALAIALASASPTPAGAATVEVIAGGGERELVAGEEIPALEARFSEPFSVDFDDQGNIYAVEYQSGNRVFRVSPEGTVTLIAGVFSRTNRGMGDIAEGDGGPATEARFNGMHDLAWHPEGALYIADSFNHRIRRIDLESGIITTFAGTGEAKFDGDGGPAAEASFNGPHTVSFTDDYKRLYVADLDNYRVRVIDMDTGVISTVVGSGERGRPEDGTAALEAPLFSPRAVTVDADENIWIASRNGHAVKVVMADTGTITTIAGLEGRSGYAGDGGPAAEALLNGPKHLCMDLQGRLVITDDVNHAIRLYHPDNGMITLLAGTPPNRGSAVDPDDPLKTGLDRPHGARYHEDGTLYIADSDNHRIVIVRPTDEDQ